jgi:hypothetical protein
VDVAVDHDREQLIARISGDQPDAAPVLRHTDQVHRTAFDLERPDAVGHEHAGLDCPTGADQRGSRASAN